MTPQIQETETGWVRAANLKRSNDQLRARIAELENTVERRNGMVKTRDIRIANLEETRRRLIITLTDVMVWINNWSPNFTDDPEWAETNAAVQEVLGSKKPCI